VGLLRELEFTSLLEDYLGKPEEAKSDYRPVFRLQELEDLVCRIKKSGLVSVDTETDSPSPTQARLVGMSFSMKPGEAFYVPLGHDYPGAQPRFLEKRRSRSSRRFSPTRTSRKSARTSSTIISFCAGPGSPSVGSTKTAWC